MRLIWALIGCLVLAQCASREDNRFQVGASPRAFVIIGAAESAANMSPRYSMLWRRLDAQGAFMPIDDNTSIEARTSAGGARVAGIPGEFVMAEVEPGVYALDGVFALIPDRNVNYVAQGVVTSPERPVFEVRPGEAVYLGIWEMNLQEDRAVTRLWRLEQADVDAAIAEVNPIVGQVRAEQTQLRAVACTPHRFSNTSTRQIC